MMRCNIIVVSRDSAREGRSFARLSRRTKHQIVLRPRHRRRRGIAPAAQLCSDARQAAGVVALLDFDQQRRSLACDGLRAAGFLLAGAALLVLAALLTWNDTSVNWALAVPLPIAAATVSLLALTPQQRRRGFELARRTIGR